MATNNFKAFSAASGANVTPQSDYELLPALQSGFQSGKASSAQINKALRQATFVASALAQYMMNKTSSDILDDGDLSSFIGKMAQAFGKDFQSLDATLTALASLATGADKVPYFTGKDTVSQADLTQVGRDIIGKSSVSDIISYLSLGTAASKNVGTGSNQIPDMNSFGFSTGSIGYAKLPNGMIIQYGFASTSTSGPATVGLPISFSSANYRVAAVGADNATPNILASAPNTSSSFSASAWGANNTSLLGVRQGTTFNWIAVGF